jgi:hypothetical protein
MRGMWNVNTHMPPVMAENYESTMSATAITIWQRDSSAPNLAGLREMRKRVADGFLNVVIQEGLLRSRAVAPHTPPSRVTNNQAKRMALNAVKVLERNLQLAVVKMALT